MQENIITFSFGENWKEFLDSLSEEQTKSAIQDIQEWLGDEKIKGKVILDIGSGSGIHSYAFHVLGAKKVDSFDYDSCSVEATRFLWEKCGRPIIWSVFSGSILDQDFIKELSEYDIVYSWGVLHHTGDLWNAIKNAASLVKKGGYFWISIYAKGPNYQRDLNLKRKYNSAENIVKRLMELDFIWRYRIFGDYSISFLPHSFKELIKICRTIDGRVRNYNTSFRWNEKKMRGMDTYHDIIDWLGGLPYEVASVDEVVNFCSNIGFHLERVKEVQEGGCSIYLFIKKS